MTIQGENSWGPGLEKLVGRIHPGSWVSYGDLAEVLDIENKMAAKQIGVYLSKIERAVPGAHRVLKKDGSMTSVDVWRWDPENPLSGFTQEEALRSEGIVFVNGRAQAAQRMGTEELRRLL
jgi:alkylated DNA nucleotide flippase Atl1